MPIMHAPRTYPVIRCPWLRPMSCPVPRSFRSTTRRSGGSAVPYASTWTTHISCHRLGHVPTSFCTDCQSTLLIPDCEPTLSLPPSRPHSKVSTSCFSRAGHGGLSGHVIGRGTSSGLLREGTPLSGADAKGACLVNHLCLSIHDREM